MQEFINNIIVLISYGIMIIGLITTFHILKGIYIAFDNEMKKRK